MELQSLPIVPLDQLHIVLSCLPTSHLETPENIDKISSFIFRRLQQMIPPDQTKLRGLLAPFQLHRRGFDALYAIARTSLEYLRPIKTGWGPIWTPTDDPSTYVGRLQEFVRTSKLSRQHQYSDLDQSYEMIHQAMQNHNFAAGLCLMTQLDQHQRECTARNTDAHPLPPNLMLTSMINFFIDYPITQPPTTAIQPSINKFEGKKKKFEYRNKIQCTCCQLYGHNIGDQICRIGAQMYHAKEYSVKHPAEYKTNADKHRQMNQKNIVKFVNNTSKMLYTKHEHEQERENMISMLDKTTDPDHDEST